MRVEDDALVETLTKMAKRLPDEVKIARETARKEGLDEAIVQRLATQLIERAGQCGRLLNGA